MKRMIAVLMLSLGLMATTAQAEQMLQVKGSDTLINLVQRLAEVYMEKNPGKFIAVTGGGSGTGIAALINKKCDIANSSRLMKPKEISMAQENGVTAKRVVIAIDGLSVITNGDNPVNQLTVDQIGAIFRGDITNWSNVGGPDMPITLYGRQSNSGTYVFFQEYVLKGDYSPKMSHMNGTAQIVEAVRNDKSGVGYVGVGYIKNDQSGLTVVHVAAKQGGDYSDPLNIDDINSGKYPISRPLNQYIAGNPAGDTKAFLDFELSEEGQKVVEEEGFFALPEEYKKFNEQAGL